MKVRRPFALIKTATGGELLLGPLDNHPVSRTLPLSHALPWKTEAQEQAPPLEPGWTGKVLFQEVGEEWPIIDLESLEGFEPNKVHDLGHRRR